MSENNVYASDQTLNHLGFIADRLPQIAEANVIIISRDDIIAYENNIPPSLYDIENKTQAFYDTIDVVQMVENISTLFNKIAPNPESAELWLDAALQNPEIFDFIVNQDPAATGFDIDGNGQNDFGFIVAPKMTITNQETLRDLSHRPSEIFSNAFQGTGKEGLATIMFHEADHINDERDTHTTLDQTILNQTILLEMHADDAMKQAYEEEVNAGNLASGFLEHIQNARLIGGLGYGGLIGMGYDPLAEYAGDHSTHAVFSDDSLTDKGLNDIDNPDFSSPLVTSDITTLINGMMVWQKWAQQGPESFADNTIAQSYFSNYSTMVNAGADPTQIYQLGYQHVSHEYETYAIAKALEAEGLFDLDAFSAEKQYISELDTYFKHYENDVFDDPRYLETVKETREFILSSGMDDEIRQLHEASTSTNDNMKKINPASYQFTPQL